MKQIASKERIIKFDTDAKPIEVDNRCSACISPYVEDFIGPLEDMNKTIKGFAGAQTNNPKTGTICWQWLDDAGRMHTFEIPNSYYVPECEQRLLSPQHWAQTRSAADRATTHCITSALNVYLRWTKGEESYELTLPFNKRGSNVGTLYSHPGYNKYDLFCQAADIKITDDKDPIAVPAHLISDDEDKEENGIKPQIGPLPLSIPKRNHLSEATPLPPPPEDKEFDSQGANPRELHLSPEPKGVTSSKFPTVIEDDDTSVVIDEEDRQESTPEAELLMAHHQFQHISFSKLQDTAHQGIQPRRLAQCKIKTCSACLYGKAMKRAWRSKQERQRQWNQALKPRDVISADQMVSPVPGLIAQMVGFLMKQCYKYAPVFIDQVSRMGFLYHQKTCSAEETIEAKRAFENYAANQGVHTTRTMESSKQRNGWKNAISKNKI